MHNPTDACCEKCNHLRVSENWLALKLSIVNIIAILYNALYTAIVLKFVKNQTSKKQLIGHYV